MMLSDQEVLDYETDGFVIRPGAMRDEDIGLLADRTRRLEGESHPGHVLESHGRSHRALHGCHLYDDCFKELVRLPQFLGPARQLLGTEVYVHQLKINLKCAFSGDIWPWHQDYIYWRNEDGIPRDAVTSVMIFLDNIDEFNGPIFFVPGSHRQGCIEMPRPADAPAGWESNVSANLTYQVSEDMVAELIRAGGMVSAKGPRGTAVWFHGNIVHASLPNISPQSRRLVIVTYNAVDNVPVEQPGREQRPVFLSARDRRPLQPLPRASLSPRG
jgi:ectoine hydroxylase